MRRFVTFAAAVLAALPGVASAGELPCLSPGEFTALSSYSLSSVITGTSQRCESVLPADAWLRTGGPDLAARYAALRVSAWPGAKAALLKVAPAINPDVVAVMAVLPDPTLQQIADSWIQSQVTQQLPVDRCGKVDRLLRLLSPLPPESTAELVGLAVGLGARSGGGGVGKLRICAA